MSGPSIAATSANVQRLAAELDLDEQAYATARDLAGLQPEASDWQRYIDHFLMAVGATLIVAGIAAFVAWNWADLAPRYQFALVQLCIAGCALGTWRCGIDTVGGRASLFALAFLFGVLFALFGQTYQTGADPYGLFLAWAILALPLAVVGRQWGLWLLELLLLNLALIMYWTQVVDPPVGWWQLSQLLGPLVWLSATLLDSTLASFVFALNAVALLLWEFASEAKDRPIFLTSRLFPRITAFMALTCVAIPTTLMVFGASLETGSKLTAVSPALYLLASVLGLFYYQRRQRDLLILTLLVFGAIMVVTAFFVRFLMGDFFSGTLTLTALLVAQVAGAAYWLRSVTRRWEADA